MSTSNKNTLWIIYSIIVALLYSIVRYNIFKNVPWSDFPVYIFNKSVALTIVFLMFYYRTSISRKNMEVESVWSFMYILVFSHMILSLTILGPSYFSKFYLDGHLNLTGSLSLFTGVVAFIGFSIMGIFKLLKLLKLDFTINKSIISVLKFTNISFVLVHVFIMGINGWLSPSEWPGYLLPISLVAFIVCLISIIVSGYYTRKLNG